MANVKIRPQYGFVGLVFIISFALFISCGSDGSGGGDGDETLYYIGGNVDGLSGTLVLQNNGGDDLTIASDGLFEFDTPLPDQAIYAATLLTSPSNQNCTCTNGSGVVNGADIDDIEVTCVNKTWTHPSDLSDNISLDGKDAYYPAQVAMDNNGNAIITWQQSDGSGDQIFMSEYRNGSWTHPTSLSDKVSPDGQAANYPQVAMDSNGNAIITWYQSDGSNSQIFKSEYRNGSWTHPSGLSDNISPDGQGAYNPQVAMDDSGNAIIIWRQGESGSHMVFKSEYHNGVWIHPVDLNDKISPDGGHVGDGPDVAMDDNGNAIITWGQLNSGDYHILKSEYRNDAWTHPSGSSDKINPDGTKAGHPRVVMDNNGNAIIVWVQSDVSNYQIFKSEYRNDAWTHPSGLNDNISLDGKDAYSPRVAMDSNGNAIITWQLSDGSNSQIFKSEYRNGSWIHPSGFSDNISPDGQGAHFPAVAMDSNGNAIITWQQSDGSDDHIFKSEYRNGAWTHPDNLDLTDNISPDGGGAWEPAVAMDNYGNAIVTWCGDGDSVYQIFKSEYR